ncbi:MAG TPA: hypothetical protein VHY91_13660 [Pirellulales bacterium]|jgi:hypothetical protein|nr:hypothetical protein [Pirellulales bacterium]
MNKMYRVITETGPVQDRNDGSYGHITVLLYLGYDERAARLEFERSRIADYDRPGDWRETKLQSKGRPEQNNVETTSDHC